MDIPSELEQTFSSNFSQFANSGSGGSMWQTTLPHGLRTIAGTGELEYYSDPSVGVDPFSVNDGSLDITATAGSTGPGTSYTSGVITTESSFSQLYGYFQMTATLPAGAGYWPAFWLLPTDLSGTQELDVMEEYGTNPTQYTASIHSPSSGLSRATTATPDLTAGPNTYGMYWTPQSISYYFNNQLVAVAPTPPDMDTPMFMIANLAIADDVSSSTTFPGTMEISGIQAYAYNPDVLGPTPQLLTNVPATLDATLGERTAVSGVTITDPAAGASDIISVTVSDQSLGILSVISHGRRGRDDQRRLGSPAFGQPGRGERNAPDTRLQERPNRFDCADHRHADRFGYRFGRQHGQFAHLGHSKRHFAGTTIHYVRIGTNPGNGERQ